MNNPLSIPKTTDCTPGGIDRQSHATVCVWAYGIRPYVGVEHVGFAELTVRPPTTTTATTAGTFGVGSKITAFPTERRVEVHRLEKPNLHNRGQAQRCLRQCEAHNRCLKGSTNNSKFCPPGSDKRYCNTAGRWHCGYEDSAFQAHSPRPYSRHPP